MAVLREDETVMVDVRNERGDVLGWFTNEHQSTVQALQEASEYINYLLWQVKHGDFADTVDDAA